MSYFERSLSFVLLANGQSLGLLSFMVCRIHDGLRAFFKHFIGGQMAESRVEILYAYLMAWFTTHCEELITGGVDADKEDLLTLVNLKGGSENTNI